MSTEKSSRTARCEICEYWIDKTCHRYPPVVIARVVTLSASPNQGRDEPEVDSSADSEWPETKPDDWCGEWRDKFTSAHAHDPENMKRALDKIAKADPYKNIEP